MNGENDHLFDDEHLDLCPVCGKQECECDDDDAEAARERAEESCNPDAWAS